jgi:hypothetical protein
MPLDRFEVRVSIQKVLLGLVLVIVPLSIVGLYLTARSDHALAESSGTYFKTLAQMYSNDISHQISDRVAAVNLIAAEPAVVAAVKAANRAYEGKNEQAINEKIGKVESTWGSAQSAPTAKALLATPVSETLRHYRDMDPRLLRITITDERGVSLAATSKPAHFAFTQDQTWQTAYAGGQGSASITNILYDEPNKAYYTNISIPVKESGTGQVAGIATAAVDITPILASFQQDSIADGAQAFLVSDDGTVVSGPRMDVFARVKSDQFAALRDSLGSVNGRQNGYLDADLSSGRTIIGFADTGLSKSYKNLSWTVVVSQPEDKLAAPIRAVTQFALLMAILGLFMITLLGVYYALHRKQQFADIQEVLPGSTLARP